MKSMTGYSSLASRRAGLNLLIEIKAVNNRYFRGTLRTSPLLARYDQELEAILREDIARGSVTLFMELTQAGEVARASLNEAVLASYLKQFRGLGKKYRIADPPSWEGLLALPGVVEEKISPQLALKDWEWVAGELRRALKLLVAMREKEGGNLRKVLLGHLEDFAAAVKEIEKRAPLVSKTHVDRLVERLNQMTAGAAIFSRDELGKEAALLAERSDITEELHRLVSHAGQCRDTLRDRGGNGRKLDFLVQEMMREINTIGAKVADAESSRHVVAAKLEIEKMREQIQNIE